MLVWGSLRVFIHLSWPAPSVTVVLTLKCDVLWTCQCSDDSGHQCTCRSLWRFRGSTDAPWPLTSCTLVYSCLQRRQEEGYYSRLEAERRRQHDEAARRLLEPEDPGLSRPPLPRDYEPPSLSPAPSAPPPPPQRNASYLKTQVLSPDSLFTAKFVAYDDEEEEDCGPAGQDKYPSTRKSHEHLPLAAPKPQQPRPASDGIFLSNSFQPPLAKANSTANKAGPPPPPPGKPSFYRPGHWKGRGKEGMANHTSLVLMIEPGISVPLPLGTVHWDHACLGLGYYLITLSMWSPSACDCGVRANALLICSWYSNSLTL